MWINENSITGFYLPFRFPISEIWGFWKEKFWRLQGVRMLGELSIDGGEGEKKKMNNEWGVKGGDKIIIIIIWGENEETEIGEKKKKV